MARTPPKKYHFGNGTSVPWDHEPPSFIPRLEPVKEHPESPCIAQSNLVTNTSVLGKADLLVGNSYRSNPHSSETQSFPPTTTFFLPRSSTASTPKHQILPDYTARHQGTHPASSAACKAALELLAEVKSVCHSEGNRGLEEKRLSTQLSNTAVHFSSGSPNRRHSAPAQGTGSGVFAQPASSPFPSANLRKQLFSSTDHIMSSKVQNRDFFPDRSNWQTPFPSRDSSPQGFYDQDSGGVNVRSGFQTPKNTQTSSQAGNFLPEHPTFSQAQKPKKEDGAYGHGGKGSASNRFSALTIEDPCAFDAENDTCAQDSAVHSTVGPEAPQLTEQEYRSRAKANADFIKAGGCEIPGAIPPDQGPPGQLNPSSLSVPADWKLQQHPSLRNQQVMVLGSWTGPSNKPVIMVDQVAELWRAKGSPSWQDIAGYVVLSDTARMSEIKDYSVIKLAEVPYNVTKEQIMEFIGERAAVVKRPLGSNRAGIHIIMERSTAKSMDCYVEFETARDAEHVFARLDAAGGRRMIGDRRIDVSMSSQEVLMKELFPRAKCIAWQGVDPALEASSSNFGAVFNGFVTKEEMTMVVKFSQAPQRSRFSLKHPQRPYESIISLLLKYPWHAVSYYKLEERDLIFKTVRDLLRCLVKDLIKGTARQNVDEQLLDDLLQAGLTSPGFSEKHRAELVDAVEFHLAPRVYITPSAPSWPFEALNRNEDTSIATLIVIIGLLKQATTPAVSGPIGLAEASALTKGGERGYDRHFGFFQIAWPANKHLMTIADVAALEWRTVQETLRRVVPEN